MNKFQFEGERLRETRFPLGGMGAGCVSLDGGARLVDWEIANRPAKNTRNGFSHIAVKAEQGGKLLSARALNGPLAGPYSGDRMGGNFGHGPSRHTLAGAPHFSGVRMTAHFPIAKWNFEGDFPAEAAFTAWSPFEPMNEDDSSLPLGLFEVSLTNTQADAVDYTVAFTINNPHTIGGRNAVVREGGITALVADSAEFPQGDPRYGQLCVATNAADASAQACWYRGPWFDQLNMFWHDFAKPGRAPERTYLTSPKNSGDPGTLFVHLTAKPGETVTAHFALSWYYPLYQHYWHPQKYPENGGPSWRNWYATRYNSAFEVAKYGLTDYGRLYKAAQTFVNAMYGGTLPSEVTDAASAALAVLKSPTCLRLEDGSFYGWEGCNENTGSCEGSCTHVWNYQYALPFLFPRMERSMRELDFKHNMDDAGGMHFRLQLPAGSPYWSFRPCVDGQMGGIIKTYRDWKIFGDAVWLRELWPRVKASLEYAWSPENPDRWDPDKTGVMQGRQHHTLDMELFGPNSWLTSMYLAALEAAARMAEAMDEPDFAAECRRLREKGTAWVDEHLFNGEYYQQNVDLTDKALLASFGDDAIDAYWNAEIGEMKYQIGDGSSIDQVLGQWHADLCGLGDVLNPEKVNAALAAIYRENFIARADDHFNPCRLYCVETERGLLICAYPEKAQRPAISAPYAEETMHGFEYQAACHMILRGMVKEGLECVRAVRDRYDGSVRSPWNEIECGNNYARSMATWALVNAYLGLTYDMSEYRIGFNPIADANAAFSSIWAVNNAWGTISCDATSLRLTILGGSIVLRALDLPSQPYTSAALDGKLLRCSISAETLAFSGLQHLSAGQVLEISV